jgi:hypothetical protein
MVSLQDGRPVAGTVSSLDPKLSAIPEPCPVVRRSCHNPCPACGSRTVRSRDGRDMCLICGYLQADA